MQVFKSIQKKQVIINPFMNTHNEKVLMDVIFIYFVKNLRVKSYIIIPKF